MRYGSFRSAILTTGLALLAAASSLPGAHHDWGQDRTQQLTLKGSVTKLEWQNPHVWFYMDVRDEKTGKTVNYGVEMAPPHLLEKQNPPLPKTAFMPGARFTVVGYPFKAGYFKDGLLRVRAMKVTATAQ
jgi:hypothetical protein